MFTTIQDLGRFGYQDAGIPSGGALDKTSARAANAIVGNPEDEPLLEITMTGPTMHYDGACEIAIIGAEMSPVFNYVPGPRYQLINVPAGAILKFGKLRSGCRTYLSVRGSWQVIKWLGSASALNIGQTELVP